MVQFGPGPHATPLIVGDKVLTVGITTRLHCFDKNTGKVLWSHDLVKDFGGTQPGRGYSSSPIAHGNTVILPVGGKPGQRLIAFDQSTGAVAWKSLDFEITHSSPIMIRFAGRDQLVVFMAAELAGVDPSNGALIWRHEHPTQYGANLATPAWDGKDTLVCSAAYDSGTRAVRLAAEGDKIQPKELWYNKKMRVHHGNIIILDGHIYTSSGDFGPAFFMCADLATGQLRWRERGFAKATSILADGRLIILDQDGHLALASVTPEHMTVHSRCKVAEPSAWAAPTLVGSTLYLRDRQHIMAFDLS